MKQIRWRTLLGIGCLIVITCVAMAYSNKLTLSGSGVAAPVITTHSVVQPPQIHQTKSGVMTIAGSLTQDKIFVGGEGKTSLSLTMKADEIAEIEKGGGRHVDMVIVLDRSGSMGGSKIQDARQAVINLISGLTEKDRFALITYANDVSTHSTLVNMTDANRENMKYFVQGISAGGGTNLGAGLQEGINVLLSAGTIGNLGKIILISDGLANQGIIDTASLGNIASVAVQREFSISTAGVGHDFNETLMTTIADRGAGTYYYLENPAAFASVFQKEFTHTRTIAAGGVEIRIPLKNGISLIDASGYPIETDKNLAILHPGDILSGQTRIIYLTFRVPTNDERNFDISGITARYMFKNESFTISLSEPFQIACVKDKTEALSSIRKDVWEEKVLQSDFNRLKEDVAADIRAGNEKDAMDKIQKYETEQQTANDVVGSSKVADNLQTEVQQLRETVSQTFKGAPEAVEKKQKSNAKILQYEGYKTRRAKE